MKKPLTRSETRAEIMRCHHQKEPPMTTTRESVRNAIVAELRRQMEFGTGLRCTFVESHGMVHVDGVITLDKLADAIVEHVA